MDGNITVQDLTIAAVPAGLIDVLWDRIIPFMEMVEVRQPEDVDIGIYKERLEAGNYLLITISRGSEIVAINILDVRVLDTGYRCLYIPITAGEELDVWMEEFLEVAKRVAKDYQCDEIRGIACRNGWLRKLKPYGWDTAYTTIRYKLGE